MPCRVRVTEYIGMRAFLIASASVAAGIAAIVVFLLAVSFALFTYQCEYKPAQEAKALGSVSEGKFAPEGSVLTRSHAEPARLLSPSARFERDYEHPGDFASILAAFDDELTSKGWVAEKDNRYLSERLGRWSNRRHQISVQKLPSESGGRFRVTVENVSP